MTAIADLPDIRPSLLLDFANSGRVDPRIECTRASAATCYGPDGKLRTVAANVPRIDYDPVTGKCLGLLVEEARTNLLRQSSLLSDAAWVKSDVLVTPSDTQNALGLDFIKLTPISGTYKTINQTLSTVISDNQIVAFSVFAKAGEMNTIRLGVRDRAAFNNTGHFNLLTGEASRQEITGKYLGDGWWRVTLAGTNVGSGSVAPLVHIYSINNGDAHTPGDGVSGIYIAAPQLEIGSFPTSYIPTEGAAVTRAADAPYISPLASTWFSASAGTLTVSYDYGASNIANMVGLGLDGGSSSNSMTLATTSGSTDLFIVTANGNGVFNNGFSAITSGVRKTTGLTWGNRRISQSANGGAIASVEGKDLPVGLNRMTFGHSGYFSQSRSNGHIARVVYYPVQVTDAQLQRLTA